jgi:hypothetical protein
MGARSPLGAKYLIALKKPAESAMIIIALPMVTTSNRVVQRGVEKSSSVIHSILNIPGTCPQECTGSL